MTWIPAARLRSGFAPGFALGGRRELRRLGAAATLRVPERWLQGAPTAGASMVVTIELGIQWDFHGILMVTEATKWLT